MIVSEGAVPSDDGHSRANCEAFRKLVSSTGDPIGDARGSGVVFVPQVEAPATSIGDPFGKARGCGLVFVPQVRPDSSGTIGGSGTGGLMLVVNGLAHGAFTILVVTAAQRCGWTSTGPSSWTTTMSTSTKAATLRGSLST